MDTPLKQALAAQSMTQSALGQEVGVTVTYINLIANGHRVPSNRVAAKIARTLGRPTLDLFPALAQQLRAA